MSVRFVRPQRDDALQPGVEPDVGFLIVSHSIQVVGRWMVVGLGAVVMVLKVLAWARAAF
jgi:hypothetical protein